MQRRVYIFAVLLTTVMETPPATPNGLARTMAAHSMTSPAPVFDLPSPSSMSPSVEVHVANVKKIKALVDSKQITWETLDAGQNYHYPCYRSCSLYLHPTATLGLQQEFSAACIALKAADRDNDCEAQCALGEIHFFGCNTPMNATLAYKYWKRAALQGHGQSQFYVGIAHRGKFGSA